MFAPEINVRETITLVDQIIKKGKDIEWVAEYEIQPNGLICKGSQIVVPPDDEIKTQIVQANHDAPLAGHPGPAKTIELVKRRFYWPDMDTWITEYVQSCDECQRTKTRRGKTQPPLAPLELPNEPWEHITMDFVTGLPQATTGVNTILTVVDRFSKMAVLISCQDTTNSADTARLLMRHVYTKHGIPKIITTDRGPQFVSSFTKHIYQFLQITPATSTAYHPQTDGQSERMNQEMEQYLRTYVELGQQNWDQWLPIAEFAINNRQHSGTKRSPFQIIYGRNPRMELLTDSLTIGPIEDFSQEIIAAQKQTKEALIIAQKYMKTAADKHRGKIPEFKIGDQVLLDGRNLALSVPTRKLAKRNLGPYKIVQKHGTHNYELAFPRNVRIHPVFYAGLLIPYKQKEFPGRTTGVQPQPEIINDEPEYEIGEILDVRKNGTKFEYLIRWDGYAEDEDTWEPFGPGLVGASEFIKEYYEANPEQPQPPRLEQWLKKHLPKAL